MPRAARVAPKEHVYHVLTRGNNRQVVFEDDEDFRKYTEILLRYKEKYHFKMYHYVWTALPEKETPLLGSPVLPFAPVTAPEKIDLFLNLFRCRDDVYPKLWENKSKGTKGYSPVCANEWVRGV